MSKCLRDPLGDLRLVGRALLEREADILGHGHVRKERVALKHHADAAPVGRHSHERRAVDVDLAARGVVEAGDHHQRGGLAGSARTQQGDELARLDREAHIIDRGHGAEALADLVEHDRGSGRAPSVGPAE
jgi:hypothetical protein